MNYQRWIWPYPKLMVAMMKSDERAILLIIDKKLTRSKSDQREMQRVPHVLLLKVHMEYSVIS